MATCFVRSWMWHMCCHLTWVVFYPPSPSNSARMNDPMILSSTSYAVSVLRSNRQFRSTCTSSNRMNNKCHTAPASCFLYRRPYLIYLFSFYLVVWHSFFHSVFTPRFVCLFASSGCVEVSCILGRFFYAASESVRNRFPVKHRLQCSWCEVLLTSSCHQSYCSVQVCQCHHVDWYWFRAGRAPFIFNFRWIQPSLRLDPSFEMER